MGGTISDIVKVVDDAVKQIILQIDPSIIKVKNSQTRRFLRNDDNA
jgi:hypothetical protein